MSELLDAAALLDADPDAAYDSIQAILKADPDESRALYMLGVLMSRAERFAEALAIFERVVRLAPRRAQAWNALGQALDECDKPVEARSAFKQALELEKKPLHFANIASSYMHEANIPEAMRWCRRALALDPEHKNARQTLGFAQLATGQWREGWDNYEFSLDGKFRQEVKLGAEPRWDGSPVKALFVYGEQGIGDEITYASILGDIPESIRVTLECDTRLAGLFRRSFPRMAVHGTRRTEKPWAEGLAIDAGCAIGSLTRFYRPTPDSCPQRPYLVADPERRLQWRALFDSWAARSTGRRPVIGICWSGGRPVTGMQRRAVGLEAFRSLIQRVDAHWVSLQYTDAAEEVAQTGLPVRIFDRATRSPDYDDTAAMVAELDYVVGPPTAVHHLAGALGVPSTILVPSQPMWNVALGDRLPWNAANVYHRQKPGESWADCITRLEITC